jgi:penicillin amidase
MHLGLGVPNTWYRAQFNFPDPDLPQHMVTITGVTLPGVPLMVVGSNGHIAWGFTNSYGDWVDLVQLHVDVRNPDRYLTAHGWRVFVHHRETIRVAGGKPVTQDVKDTIWGPVVKPDHNGVPRAVHWIAGDPAATNFELDRMAQARTVKEAMAVANRAGIPAQNFLVVDSDGNIAWTIAGRIPVRTGYDPDFPAYWDKAGTGWTGWLAPNRYPRIVDPPGGRLWTANARVVNAAMLGEIGDGGYDLGARARQIRNDLDAAGKFTPAGMLNIQLDDRAVFLGRWRSLILRLLSAAHVRGHPRRAQFVHYVRNWGGRAAIGSVGYRLVRDFHSRVDEVVFNALTAACRQASPDFDYTVLSQREGPLWALVTQQPRNLLDPEYATWNDLLLAAVDHVIGKLWLPDTELAARTWGQRNTVRIRATMSRALPVLSEWLDMKPVELPGDHNMPRVQGVHFGASERMVVEPGHERVGIFEMPAGESGYPLSPYYRNSEPGWQHGSPASFLPGRTRHQLNFQPEP